MCLQTAAAMYSDLRCRQVRLREELRRVVDLMQQEVAQFSIGTSLRLVEESIDWKEI